MNIKIIVSFVVMLLTTACLDQEQNDDKNSSLSKRDICVTEWFQPVIIVTQDTTDFGMILGSWSWVKTSEYSFSGYEEWTPASTDSTLQYVFFTDSTIKIFPDSCLTEMGSFTVGDISIQVDSLNDPPIPGLIINKSGLVSQFSLSFSGIEADTMVISQAAWDGRTIQFKKIVP